jgi:transposase
MHDGRGQNHRAYLWQYGTPGCVVFDFRIGRAREGPKLFLDNFDKLLQTDGYTSYDGGGGEKHVYAACWAHARRKVVDVLKLNAKDATAAGILAHIDTLFAVGAAARELKLDQTQRHQLRQKESAPLLEPLREALKAALDTAHQRLAAELPPHPHRISGIHPFRLPPNHIEAFMQLTLGIGYSYRRTRLRRNCTQSTESERRQR